MSKPKTLEEAFIDMDKVIGEFFYQAQELVKKIKQKEVEQLVKKLNQNNELKK